MPHDQDAYTVDHSTMPPSCLPTRIDVRTLVDITRLGDSWRRYLDTQTGETHDGAVYAAELQRLANVGAKRTAEGGPLERPVSCGGGRHE